MISSLEAWKLQKLDGSMKNSEEVYVSVVG